MYCTSKNTVYLLKLCTDAKVIHGGGKKHKPGESYILHKDISCCDPVDSICERDHSSGRNIYIYKHSAVSMGMRRSAQYRGVKHDLDYKKKKEKKATKYFSTLLRDT